MLKDLQIQEIGRGWARFSFRCFVVGLLVAYAQAAELKANTAAAFDRYIRVTEAQHADDLRKGHFLVIDGLPHPAIQETYARLRQGQIYIDQLHTKEDGRLIPIPGGLVHHWVGVVFIPGATLSQVVAVLQDYDNHKSTSQTFGDQSCWNTTEMNSRSIFSSIARRLSRW